MGPEQEQTNPSQNPPAAPPVAAQPAPTPPIQIPNQDQSTPVVSQSAAVAADADDDDVIEKEWVDKAREIVERNRDDPYKQSQELTLFKAEYMKKRYGKDIKIS